MKILLSKPGENAIQSYLKYSYNAPFNYTHIRATNSTDPVPGFDNDHHSIYLGDGDEVFNKARLVLERWDHFPDNWTKIFDLNSDIRQGNVVLVTFRIFGLWWVNSAQIVYTMNEQNRFGFAYGTLKGHLESGEEVFYIEKDETGKVFYHIKAFSSPAYWFVKLGYPVARFFQKRFVLQSMERVKKLVNEFEFVS